MRNRRVSATEIGGIDVRNPPTHPASPRGTVSVLGVSVDRVTADDLVRFVLERAATPESEPVVVCYLNAHTSNLAGRDAAFAELLCGAGLVYADGMAIVREARRLGSPLPERVNAGDFLPRFLWGARERNLRIALVGSRADVAQQCADVLRARVPGLEIPVVHHGHFERGGEVEKRLMAKLRAARIDVVLAGMGSPRQEAWASDAARDSDARVVWCVGALFEYFAGRSRAPVWMREAGLEWLFRLALEPRRLASRYLLGNLRFLVRARAGRRNASAGNRVARD